MAKKADKERPGFIIYHDDNDYSECLEPETYKKVYSSLNKFSKYLEHGGEYTEPDFEDGFAKMHFSMMQKKIIRDREKMIETNRIQAINSLMGVIKGEYQADGKPLPDKDTLRVLAVRRFEETHGSPRESTEAHGQPSESVSDTIVYSNVFSESGCGKDETTPTLDEVKAYVQEKAYTFDPERFYTHYKSHGWKNIRDWKARADYWEKDEHDRKTGKNPTGHYESERPDNYDQQEADIIKGLYYGQK